MAKLFGYRVMKSISLINVMLITLMNITHASAELYEDFYDDDPVGLTEEQDSSGIKVNYLDLPDFEIKDNEVGLDSPAETVRSEENYESLDYIEGIEDDSFDYSEVGEADSRSGRAQNIGSVRFLPREAALSLAEKIDAENESAEALKNFARHHPYAIARLSHDQLESILRRSDVIMALDESTLRFLMESPEVVAKLEGLPPSALAALVTNRPKILANLDAATALPAFTRLIRKFLASQSFLKQIPAEVHASLAETNFRHFIKQSDVVRILNAHPAIVNQLGSHARSLIPTMVADPNTLKSLKCDVITAVARNPDLVDTFGTKDLEKVANSARVWECLPVPVIQNLIRDSKVARAVGASDLLRASRHLIANGKLNFKIKYEMTKQLVKQRLFG